MVVTLRARLRPSLASG